MIFTSRGESRYICIEDAGTEKYPTGISGRF